MKSRPRNKELAALVKENNIDLERFNRIRRIIGEGEENWCGPRAVANLIDYHIGDASVRLEEVVSTTGGPPYWPGKVESALNHFATKYALAKRAKVTRGFHVDTIVKEIDSDQPTVLFTLLGGPWQIAHNTIIVGYKSALSSEGRILEATINTYDYGWVKSNKVGIFPATISFN